MTKDQTGSGTHFGPEDRTAHQKDRSAHAVRQISVSRNIGAKDACASMEL